MQTSPIELPSSIVWCDPDPLGGKPCFRGTRVPVDALFGNLETGVSLHGDRFEFRSQRLPFSSGDEQVE